MLFTGNRCQSPDAINVVVIRALDAAPGIEVRVATLPRNASGGFIPYARVTHAKVGSFFQDQPPDFYQVPFGFHDADAIATHLRENGFVDGKIEHVTKEAVAPWVHNLARGLVEGNPIAIAIRDAGLSFPKIVTAVAAALNEVGGDAPFRSKMNALVVSARAG